MGAIPSHCEATMTTVRFVTESVIDGSMSVGGENDAEMVLHARLGGLRVTLLVPLGAVRDFIELNAPDVPRPDMPTLVGAIRASFDGMRTVDEVAADVDALAAEEDRERLENTLGVGRRPAPHVCECRRTQPAVGCGYPAPAQLGGYTLFCTRPQGHAGECMHGARSEDLDCTWDDNGNFHARRVRT